MTDNKLDLDQMLETQGTCPYCGEKALQVALRPHVLPDNRPAAPALTHFTQCKECNAYRTVSIRIDNLHDSFIGDREWNDTGDAAETDQLNLYKAPGDIDGALGGRKQHSPDGNHGREP